MQYELMYCSTLNTQMEELRTQLKEQRGSFEALQKTHDLHNQKLMKLQMDYEDKDTNLRQISQTCTQLQLDLEQKAVCHNIIDYNVICCLH